MNILLHESLSSSQFPKTRIFENEIPELKFISFFFFFNGLAETCGMWYLSSLLGTLPAVEAWSLNHWNARKITMKIFKAIFHIVSLLQSVQSLSRVQLFATP